MTDEQRKRFHAMVRDISRQVKWAGDYMDEIQWKFLILAGAYGQKVVPNPVGDGFVILNNRRSTGLPVKDTSDLIEQLFAFGADQTPAVEWTDPTKPPLEVYAPDAKQKLQREIK